MTLMAYFLKSHDKDGTHTLVLEGAKTSCECKCSDAIYYPFKLKEDLDMALSVLKDAGIQVEEQS